tara:strand:- start:1294 stop:1491 length:198 start_codon:yes stop_codon:yes gene_type:complete
MKNFKLNLKLNKQEKEDLLCAIECTVEQVRKAIRENSADKKISEKLIMDFQNLYSKIEGNVRSYK